MTLGERKTLLERAYVLFNAREIDALLAMMTDDVEWPDVANGAVLHSKPAIRAYWEDQFAGANPQVRPTDFIAVGDEVVAVIDQRVLDLGGELLVPPTVVFHRYRFQGRLVRQMVVFSERADAVESP